MATPGGLQYAFRYSQGVFLTSASSNTQVSTASGTLGYTNRSRSKPFTMTYAGGYTWDLTGTSYMSGQFHRIFLDQAIGSRKWKFDIQDSLAYLPQSPTTGFSGIPGIGEIIGLPNPTPSTSQAILLTLNTHVLNNLAAASLGRALDFRTTATFGGSSDYLYYPDNDGINMRNTTAYGALTRLISRRTSFEGRYEFSQFEYPESILQMRTQTAFVGLQHRVTRNLTVTMRAGPQWIDSTVATLVPSDTTYAVDASMMYRKRLTRISANYIHSTSGGSGFLYGGTIDGASGNLLLPLTPDFTLGFTGGYDRTTAFNVGNGVTNSAYGGTQATWQISPNFFVFGNFTGTGQSTTLPLPSNVLNLTYQTISFGFGLSPRGSRVRP